VTRYTFARKAQVELLEGDLWGLVDDRISPMSEARTTRPAAAVDH